MLSDTRYSRRRAPQNNLANKKGAEVSQPCSPRSRAQEVRLQPGIALLMGPQGERNRGQIIHQGDGVAVFGEIDSGEIKLAGVAGFDADVGQLLGDVDGELGFGFFAAGGAEDTAEFPFLGAEGTEEKALATVAFDSEDTGERAGAAQWANFGGHDDGRLRRLLGAKFGVGLQEPSGNELGEGADLLVVLASMLPVGFEAGDPGV